MAHYSTALIAHARDKKLPLLLLLIYSQLLDFFWFVLHYFGVGGTRPDSVFEASLSNVSADFTYHHDLIPVLAYVGASLLLGRVIFKSWNSGVILALLVLVHFIFDLIVGYEHFIFGADSASLGLGLYESAPLLSMILDLAFAVIITMFYIKSEKSNGSMTSGKSTRLYLIMIIGTLFWVPNAFGSYQDLFGLNFDLGFNTLIPTLIGFEVLCVFLLYKTVLKD